jgi:hypothetical protein
VGAASVSPPPGGGGTVPPPPPPDPTDLTLAVVQDNQMQLRGPNLAGWSQLGGHTIVDALACIGEKLGVTGFAPPSPAVAARDTRPLKSAHEQGEPVSAKRKKKK